MAVGDLTPYDLKELLALTKLGEGPAAVVEKSQLRCLVDEVLRRRGEASKRAFLHKKIQKSRQTLPDKELKL